MEQSPLPRELDTPDWSETAVAELKSNGVRFVAYVPDNALRPLIDQVTADGFFTVIPATREEEAVGIVSGISVAGGRGMVLMQTSGFATLPNVLASLSVAAQIPLVIVISERGTLGDFQIGQALVHKTMRPVLTSLGIEHNTITQLDEVAFVVSRTIQQAYLTQSPAAIILSPLLTKRNRNG